MSENGGHLGSNLGAVELTLALHRVFDSPRDAILWDTGHQAYVHKIVTGRQAGFEQLRQAGGLSGYPSREESEHDYIENSHASTVLSYAYGLAVARDPAPTDRRHIVAVIGDGSMTGGMAYEALNNLGHSKRRVIIVLNDNGRSYAPTISNLTGSPLQAERRRSPNGSPRSSQHGLTPIRLNPVYVRRQRRIERFLRELPGRRRVRPSRAWRRSRRRCASSSSRRRSSRRSAFATSARSTATTSRSWSTRSATPSSCPSRARSWSTSSPRRAAATRRPRTTTRSTSTTRRSSTRPSARRRRCRPATPRRSPRRSSRRPSPTHGSSRSPPRCPGRPGLLPFQARFPERFFDVGIAEQHAVTGAAGMAMGGLRPVVAIYSTFLNRAWDQVVYDVALHRLPVVFCLDRAGITGDDGPSHHGMYDMALLSKVPGMRVLAPSSAQELQQMLHDAIAPRRRGPGRHPLPARRRPARSPSTRSASGWPARRVRAGDGRCACWPSASWSATPRRPPINSPRRGSTHAVGRPLLRPARSGDDRRRGDASAGGHRRGRHPRRRHRHGDAPTRSITRRPRPTARRSRCSAFRRRFIPHGKPDRILRQPRARRRTGSPPPCVGCSSLTSRPWPARRRRPATTVRDRGDRQLICAGRSPGGARARTRARRPGRAETLHRYERRAFTVDRKADRTEVTEADRGAETAIRAAARRRPARPRAVRRGGGAAWPGRRRWRWIVDPVDGTSNFVRGIPVWATLIALTHVDLGPVRRRGLGARRWTAAGGAGVGLGAFVDGTPIRVSTIDTLAEAQVCVTFSSGWDELGADPPNLVALQQRRVAGARVRRLLAAHARRRGCGRDRRRRDRGPALRPRRGAGRRRGGGRTFTDRLRGARRIDSGSAISSNGLLHDQVISRLAQS